MDRDWLGSPAHWSGLPLLLLLLSEQVTEEDLFPNEEMVEYLDQIITHAENWVQEAEQRKVRGGPPWAS